MLKGHNVRRLNPQPERVREWALAMTELPSVSGSPDEAAFPHKLAAMLRAVPAFSETPEYVWTIDVPGGRHARACVAALVRGSGTRTVLLTGHFDTVPIEDYGELKPVAGSANALRYGLLQRLQATAATPAEKRALQDLATEDYLPGRGLLDMKAGLAAGLGVMEAFAADPERAGNLLFLAVPDEEVNSAGARAAAPALPQIAREHGLDIVAAVNLDAIADDGDGSIGRAVALGTIGKLLPSALVIGVPAHAGYSFNGLSACAVAGALASEIEWAPDLTERSGGQIGAGPTLLGMKDGKSAYDVTTPDKVWMFWNVMLYARKPTEVLRHMEHLAQRSAAGLLECLQARNAAAGRPDAPPPPTVRVTTFETLRRQVEESVAGAGRLIAEFARSTAATHADLPEQCRQITEYVWRLSGRGEPTIVLGFASTPYLSTQLGEDAEARRLARAVEAAAETIAGRHGTSIAVPKYFQGISDMSFLGQADESEVPTIARNTPAWGAGLHWAEGRAFAGIPAINAGPWGRDYHTALERLHTPYAFTVLPDLIGEIVTRVLMPAE